MPRSTASKRKTAGFTLIEVLVALSVVAVALAAIGSLIATTVRGARSLDLRLTMIETARAPRTVVAIRDPIAASATATTDSAKIGRASCRERV